MNKLPSEQIADIKRRYAPSPEELDSKNSIKIVLIFEGFAPNANQAGIEMIQIAEGYGMIICDIITQPYKCDVMKPLIKS
jgi:hypothetical protein